MFRSVVPLSDVSTAVLPKGMAAMGPVFDYIATRFGFECVVDATRFPDEDHALSDLFVVAEKMRKAGVLRGLTRINRSHCDEPYLFQWGAQYHESLRDASSSGSSLRSDRQALTATLAECLERYLWTYESDYFDQYRVATIRSMRDASILPEAFVGLSHEQRLRHGLKVFSDDTVLSWARAKDLVTGRTVFVPAQSISATGLHKLHGQPIMKEIITTGLATGQTEQSAILGGILEVLERDAFMITWLNQLSGMRIDLNTLSLENDEYAELLALCKTYRYDVVVTRMVTDAPVHAVCATIWNKGRTGPRVAIGLGADQFLDKACIHAVAEGLRIAGMIRFDWKTRKDNPNEISPAAAKHNERAPYWSMTDRYSRLQFLVQGSPDVITLGGWEHDTETAYLERIIEWAKVHDYGIYAADLGRSRKNVSPWHVFSIIMPQMQPMHLSEHLQNVTGARLSSVPQKMGYESREPFSSEPHPFV